MSKRMKSHALLAVKGMVIGATMLVPGVSGGSMAMILGIYDRLVSSVSSFFKDVKGNFLFLALFCLGGGAGILVFARPLLYLIERFPMPMMYFFLGYTDTEIGNEYGRSRSTANYWKLSALKNFRKELEKTCHEE